MKKRKRLIPFNWLPASWGLKGNTRKIAEAEYYYDGSDLDYALLDIKYAGKPEHEEMKLKLDYEKEKIGKVEYEKALANIKDEPYVNVISMGINEENVVEGYFELDWNDAFVKMLHDAGMKGTSDEDVVNKWFNGVCRTVLLQEQMDRDYGLSESDDRAER